MPQSYSNMPRQNSTRSKNRMFTSLAVVLLAIWVTVGLGLRGLYQEAIRNQIQESLNVSRALQEQTTRVLAIVDKATLRVENSLLFSTDAHQELARIDYVRLANETGLVPEILTQLTVVDATGRVLASNLDPTGEKSGHVDLSEREHIRVHLHPGTVGEAAYRINANGLFIGRPVLGKVSQQWTIQISRKLVDRHGNLMGVVVASVNPRYFEEVYKGVQLGPSGTITLLGDDGTVRAQMVGGQSSGMGEKTEDNFDDPKAVKTATEISFIRTDPKTRTKYVAVSRHIANYPLRLEIVTSTDWALANWYDTRNITLALTILLSLVLVTIFFIRVLRQSENQSEKIRAQHQLQEMTMNAMQDGVLQLDSHGMLVSANPRALELLGTHKDTVMGAHIGEVLPGEQNQHRMTDWFAFNYNDLVQYLRRKIAQAAGGAPTIPVPLLSIDANGALLWATSTACELLGLDPAEPQHASTPLASETVAQLLLARSLSLHRPPEQQALPEIIDIPWRTGDLPTLRVPTLIMPCVDKEQPSVFWIIPDFDALSSYAIRTLHNTEWRILHPEGELIPVLLTASPLLDPYSRLSGAVLSLKDVRDIKEKEEENLRMVKKVEQSQKLDALGQLAAGVAHDFNNLLGVIQSHAELVEMKVGPDSSAIKNINAILQATVRAQDIVVKLNGLGREAKDTQQDEQRLFELHPVLTETQSLLKASLKGIDISLETVGHVPESIVLKGDSGPLQQVLVNLCVNASHAIGESRKGRILIEIRCALEGFVYVDVVDNGSGIPPEILPRIFEPFFTTKEVGKGTGLGLAMVHSIVTKMHGSIDCQSEVGVGTRFSLKLPCVIH